MTTPSAGPDPAELLGQALRAQVGGPRPEGVDSTVPGDGDIGRRRPLSSLHVVLIAAIIGLVIGIGVGFAVLLR